jgi:hypothetical protein
MAKPYYKPQPEMVRDEVLFAVEHIEEAGYRAEVDTESSDFNSVYIRIQKPWFPVYSGRVKWVDTPHTIRISDHPPNKFSARNSVHPGSERCFTEIWAEMLRSLAERRNKARSERAKAKDESEKKFRKIANFRKKGRRFYGTITNDN